MTGGESMYVGSDDLEWLLTWVSRSLCTYKSIISKTARLTDKVTIAH